MHVRCDLVETVQAAGLTIRIGAIGKSIRVKGQVEGEVDLAGFPLAHKVGIVVVIVAEVHASNAAIVVLVTFLRIDMGKHQTEYRPSQQALVQWESQSAPLLLRRPTVVGFRWSVVPDDVSMSEGVR